jgi:hypothetical protein
VNWLVGQSMLLGMPVENWTVFSFIIAMTSFVVVMVGKTIGIAE